MPNVFILPRANELEIPYTKKHVGTAHVHLIFCQDVIEYKDKISGICEEDETARKITDKIKTIAAANDESYLLYHIGYTLSLDEELLANMPHLNVRRYSMYDSSEYYKEIKILIERVCKNDKSLNVTEVIKDFFFDEYIESVLKLLHHCLTVDGAKNIADSLLKNELEFNIEHEKEEVVRKIVQNELTQAEDCLSDKYLIALEQLANELV